jgi:hypothetical protein
VAFAANEFAAAAAAMIPALPGGDENVGAAVRRGGCCFFPRFG